jgi:hypothetical protein
MVIAEARICRYCGKLSLVPKVESGIRVKHGWCCTNPGCPNEGFIQYIG